MISSPDGRGRPFEQAVLDDALNAVTDTSVCRGWITATRARSSAANCARVCPIRSGEHHRNGDGSSTPAMAALDEFDGCTCLRARRHGFRGFRAHGRGGDTRRTGGGQALGQLGPRGTGSIIVGYEIASRLARWVNPAHRLHGYHTTATVTTFGAAAAAARLQRLTSAEAQSALGIAASFAGGTFSFLADGSNVKRVHAGKAAIGGILAAQLARNGVGWSEGGDRRGCRFLPHTGRRDG